ncbi:hypothetical protein [Francisella hispaniensis]|uniref:hypothetical protein n=1 Tax=Francisella hispaniensis TaxID=622488 RepID=UPI0019039D49|nr:hypothetical protein [Francisella hispaniensis]MBK2357093.1 hypothetical protein [Francisella hispaniensis]
MKKLIVTSTFITALVSVSYATELKGSDYISTEVGSTYNYQRVNADDKDKFTIQTTIKSCNNAKTSCEYVSQIKDPNGKANLSSKYKYSYVVSADGSVYITYPNSKQQTLLLPAKIEFNKIRNDNGSNVDTKFTNTYEFKKQIPKITINGNKYNDCIELETNSTIQSNDKVQKTQSQEIYCKGIGLVKENLKETNNSSKPITYKNILISITK